MIKPAELLLPSFLGEREMMMVGIRVPAMFWLRLLGVMASAALLLLLTFAAGVGVGLYAFGEAP